MSEPLRSKSGRRVTPRSYWCSRGGLIVVVKALNHGDARIKANKAFRRGAPRRFDLSKVSVRTASRIEIALFDQILADQQAGAEGARVGPSPYGEQGEMFHVA